MCSKRRRSRRLVRQDSAGGRTRSWSIDDQSISTRLSRAGSDPGSAAEAAATPPSPVARGGGDRAGILVSKLIMGALSSVVLAAVFWTLGFLLCGDSVYDLDYQVLVVVALIAVVATAVLAVSAAHGVSGPSSPLGSVDGWRSVNANTPVRPAPRHPLMCSERSGLTRKYFTLPFGESAQARASAFGVRTTVPAPCEPHD